MSLLDKRLGFLPIEYPLADDYWTFQQMSHWLHLDIPMGRDIKDWKESLTEVERSVIGRTLKGFVQFEVVIEDYWSTKVTRWFKKPEIQAMASSFAAMESIHAKAYAHLQQSLNLTDFDAFLYEPTAKAKIDRLIATPGKSKEDIARSLAIFSAFTEGVNLFSSFAILMSFSRRNLLNGVGQIVAYSIKDETLHAKAGCWLFKTLVEEFPELLTPELKAEIYDAARATVEMEDNFIDQSFADGTIPSIAADDVKAYIRFRTNTMLKDLGFGSLYKNINKERLQNLEWFSVLSSGVELQDFFAGRVTTYAKSVADFSKAIHDWN